MNLETTNRATGAAVGFVIATVLFVALAIVVKLSVSAPAIDADRAAERSTAEDKSLNALTWADQARGIVHLPIATAMAQAAQAWQNPAAARADLIARQEKASAELPKAPEKPSAFE